MKKPIAIICLLLLVLSVGCASTNRTQTQNKLAAMSDSELISHYKMIEMRMLDIDRDLEHSMEQDQALLDEYNRDRPFNRLDHLHIGDTWHQLREEKALTRIEIEDRGMTLPPMGN